ncbi:hypothetical protein H8E77_15170 [bacterium]|nr:hypothetical protein [bacterium]
MAKKHKKERKWISSHQRGIEYSDLVWLAKQFQKQAERNSDLTLEEFAISHGIQPEFLRRFIDLGKNTITLWHGTTADRARRIMREGFRKRGKIWFTRNPSHAHGVANSRARQRGNAPVVLCCEIDLEKYSTFQKQGPNYVFRCPGISRDVIQSVLR